MQTNDWLLIGTNAFLGATALIAPYLSEWLRHRLYSPRLSFRFNNAPPDCHQTQMSDGHISFPVYYFRFKVVNDGETQAEQCECVLEKVWKENSAGELKEWGSFSPVSLKWTGTRDSIYMTLQPGREFYCDIGRIHHPRYEATSVYKDIADEETKHNKFFFELPYRHFSQWDCLTPGKYQIQITVYSQNAKKATRRFQIAWSGNWKDQELDMLNELVIS